MHLSTLFFKGIDVGIIVSKDLRHQIEFQTCAVLSRSVVSDTLQPLGLQPARLLCPWGFSRQGY